MRLRRIACQRARKVGVERGWALFCDAGWEAEWVAIGEHGGPPRVATAARGD